jgi:hypothetical protein
MFEKAVSNKTDYFNIFSITNFSKEFHQCFLDDYNETQGFAAKRSWRFGNTKF